MKIESGQRTTSLSYLLNDKRGGIGRALDRVRPEKRAAYFMAGQFCKYCFRSHRSYANAVYLSVFYSDRVAGGVPVVRQLSMEWCLLDCDLRRECVEWRRILHRSLWSQVCTAHHSSSSLYTDYSIERFERELEALRKELAENNNRSGRSSPTESLTNTPFIDNKALPSDDDSFGNDNSVSEDRKDQ